MSEIELHRKLLGDAQRNAAFYAALKAVIHPGVSTVLDIGAGTGFLSFLARRLGARSCTLIEYADTLDLAEQLARRNGIDGLTFIKAHSAEVRRRLSVDIVVTETLGNYALEEGFLETAIDARRFLKPGGTLLPARLRQFVAPVLSDRLQVDIDVWSRIGYALDFTPARTVCLNNMFVKTVLPQDLGDSPAAARCWDDLDLHPQRAAPPSRRQCTLRWPAQALAAREVRGFALWWEAELVPGIALSTSPFAPPTHWEQIYLPLLDTVALAPGDTLELTLMSDTRIEVGVRVTWRTRLLRDGRVIAEQAQDSLRGRL
ncbi:protein arginine N-methyltransferase 1 [Fontimonas thermophila]|uniref:Protein arginine N-methyltransferase 1 n=1 Tax=Fontimonas thermophila TaxID=1076937 RepID=A0A1I2JHI7_9GAMM|nr:methyltransferase domain-containing protein [Fontimonas thermophila]SFF53739.1 protein arginine N-methyltransferase 1 [Fontimonas thermophila]